MRIWAGHGFSVGGRFIAIQRCGGQRPLLLCHLLLYAMGGEQRVLSDVGLVERGRVRHAQRQRVDVLVSVLVRVVLVVDGSVSDLEVEYVEAGRGRDEGRQSVVDVSVGEQIDYIIRLPLADATRC